jgi:hypothetical protein
MTAINDMLQQPIAHAIGWALMQFVWQGAVIGLLTAALLTVLRHSAADVRYVVATIALPGSSVSRESVRPVEVANHDDERVFRRK